MFSEATKQQQKNPKQNRTQKPSQHKMANNIKRNPKVLGWTCWVEPGDKCYIL